MLTLPDSGPRIQAAIESVLANRRSDAAGWPRWPCPCADLDAAVQAGFDWARPDGIVLLSPAAPSFGVFRNYRERGEAFTRAMRACDAP